MATYCPEAVMYDLSCPICFEDYDILSRQRAPKLLLCLHTFCYECTQRLWRADGTLECSLCRTLHTEVTLAELFDNPVILQHLRKQGEEQDMKMARRMDMEMRNGRCSPKTPDRGADVIDITSPAARGEEWENRRAEGPLFGGVLRPMPPLTPIAPPPPPRLMPHQEEEEEDEEEDEVNEPGFFSDIFPDLDDDFQTILSDAESLVGEEEEEEVVDVEDTAEELETTGEDVEDMTQDLEDTIEDIAENLEDVVENLEATVEDLEATAEDIMPWVSLGDEEEEDEEDDDEEEEEEEEEEDRWHSASDDMTSSPWVEDFSMDDDIKPDSPDYLDWFVTW